MSFTVIPPAPTVASFNPTSGKGGDVIAITGTNFTGASSVKFNGVPASFKVDNDTQIAATVPTGCSSGLIEITTEGGRVSSSTGFTIAGAIALTIQGEGTTLTLAATSINFVGAGVVVTNSDGVVTVSVSGGDSSSGGSNTIDSDAQAVFNAIKATGVILTQTEKDVCNNRIKAMKSDGVWIKRIAYYGFLGGTAASHAINWKAPGTYNLTWNGNLIHSKSGVQGDGSSGWGNTNIPLSSFNAQNTHLAAYNRSNLRFTTGTFTSMNSQIQALFWDLTLPNNLSIYRSARGANNSGNNADVRNNRGMTSGYLLATATAEPNIFLYKNGQNVSDSRPSGLPENYNFTSQNTIEIFRYGGTADYTSAQIASFSIGYGLQATEVLADYQSEQTYQSALQRQI